MKAKGTMAVINGCRGAWSCVPDRFYGSTFADHVRRIIQRPGIYTDSALRKMRVLKAKGEINFRCLSKIDSLYEKIEV